MKKRTLLVLLLLFSLILLDIGLWRSGSIPSPLAAVQPTPLPTLLCPSIQKGLTLLNARYNPSLGLLNESPWVAPEKYWLTNDNALAAFAYSQLGQNEMSTSLLSSIRKHGRATNGLIEAAWGSPVSFPPFIANQRKLSKPGPDEIWQELHEEGNRFEDWAEYSDLGFLGAFNQSAHGRIPESIDIYSRTLAQFDGTGFRDKAFNGQYETYKLALALYTGSVIKVPIPQAEQILKILRGMQSADGGFITHYRDIGMPEGDANTETTSWALLAEKFYGCGLD